MHAVVQLEQFELDTQQEKLLFVELFTINAEVRSISNCSFLLFFNELHFPFEHVLAQAKNIGHCF